MSMWTLQQHKKKYDTNKFQFTVASLLIGQWTNSPEEKGMHPCPSSDYTLVGNNNKQQ